MPMQSQYTFGIVSLSSVKCSRISMADNLAPSIDNNSMSRLSKGIINTIGHWFKKVLVGMARQCLLQ
jgi:hypothetical protein